MSKNHIYRTLSPCQPHQLHTIQLYAITSPHKQGQGLNRSIFKSKMSSDFLLPFYMKKQNPKKFSKKIHFWQIAPKKTAKSRFWSRNHISAHLSAQNMLQNSYVCPHIDYYDNIQLNLCYRMIIHLIALYQDLKWLKNGRKRLKIVKISKNVLFMRYHLE